MKRNGQTSAGSMTIIGLVVAVVLVIVFLPTSKSFASMISSLFDSDKDNVNVPEELKANLEGLTSKYSEKAIPQVTLDRLKIYDEAIKSAAAENNLDPNLIKAIIVQESGGKQETYGGSGEYGLMQLMPDTARAMGLKIPFYPLNSEKISECNSKTPEKCNPLEDERFDPVKNIQAGSKCLRQELDKTKNVELALVAYNAGFGTVQKKCKIEQGFESCVGLREVTQKYIPSAMGYYSTLAA